MSFIAAQSDLAYFPAGVTLKHNVDANLSTIINVGAGELPGEHDLTKILTVEAHFIAEVGTLLPNDFRSQLHTADAGDGQAPDFGLQIIRLDGGAAGAVSAASPPVSGVMRLNR